MNSSASEDTIRQLIQEAELSAKAVWEIDGTTVYVRDILIDNGNASVDWFTFDRNVDMNKMGNKVEKLAHKIIGDTVKPLGFISKLIGYFK